MDTVQHNGSAAVESGAEHARRRVRALIRRIAYVTFASGARVNAWLRHGRNHPATVRPDRLVWIDPNAVAAKPLEKPVSNVLSKPILVGGNWDEERVAIADDPVYEAFYERFVNGKPWEATGYIDFLATTVSDHGDVSASVARRRCARLDRLYDYITSEGYRTQQQLERDGELIGDLSSSLLPPVYREVAVDVSRDGSWLWNGGMHRLVIAQLANVERIPVRINVRHRRWQRIRDDAVTDGLHQSYHDHPDVACLLSG